MDIKHHVLGVSLGLESSVSVTYDVIKAIVSNGEFGQSPACKSDKITETLIQINVGIKTHIVSA